MRTSELIELLEKSLEKDGDLEVKFTYNDIDSGYDDIIDTNSGAYFWLIGDLP